MNIFKFYTLPLAALVRCGLFLIPACKNNDPEPVVEVKLASALPSDVVYDWNELFLQVER